MPFAQQSVRPFNMTNTIAIWLGLVITALLAADYIYYDWANTLFLLRKFMELIEWLAFWR